MENTACFLHLTQLYLIKSFELRERYKGICIFESRKGYEKYNYSGLWILGKERIQKIKGKEIGITLWIKF